MKERSKNIKIKTICIILSVITTLFSLLGNIIVTETGRVPLLLFESFYAYIILIIATLYVLSKNKNANTLIMLTLFTYLWTYHLVNEMFLFSDIKMWLGTSFYIYFSSAIFLIISLFFNDKKKVSKKEGEEKKEIHENLEEQTDKQLDKNNFIFTNIIIGIKGLPLNADVLLVNNIENNKLDLIYQSKEQNQTIEINVKEIKNISFQSKIKMANKLKETEENETKSMLLSAVMFGGNPLMQMVGDMGFNNLFDSVSNNYDKVNYNVYYEIIIETVLNNEEARLILNTDTNPEEFINLLLKKKV